ncbi:MAG: AAA family ATPase [Gemmatimonadetes bacterium]|nr:AAA family ATPase [Gemmatimonadota bacterium]
MSVLFPLVPDHEPSFNLTGTRVAEFFRFGCERQLRYDLVSAAERGVDRTVRPGARLLSAAGRSWERKKVRELIRRFGARRVAFAGWTEAGSPARIPAEAVVQLLRDPGDIEVLVQPELRLPDPERFARRYGLDPRKLRIASAVPDMIRVRRLSGGRRLFQIVDIKASAKARIPHYAQIAYYSLLLDEICELEGISAGATDRRWGRIWSRAGRGPARFALGAYRHHVEEVLRRDLPRVLDQAQGESAWHLSPRCAGCGYFGHCRAQADGSDDLARVVGITPLAKRVLRGKGVRTVRELALNVRKTTYQGCHTLEAQADRLAKRASALSYGKVLDVEARTHLMPRVEDVHVVLTAEGDPVSGRCFALGFRVNGLHRLPAASTLGVWIAAAGTHQAERVILQSLLDSVERVLDDLATFTKTGRRGGPSLHLYVYDRAEAELLRELLLRHLGDATSRPAIARLLRVISPGSVALQPGFLGATPGTIVADVVAALFALPVPYAYDLAAVSDRLRPAERAAPWRPPADLAWPFSSQIAFERIHEVWHRPAPEADALRNEMQSALTGKLIAIDSVIRAVRERSARSDKLQMRKEPFGAAAADSPLRDPDLESMRLFTELESAAEAAGLQSLHVLPAAERARRFECIRGLSLVERRADGKLLFEFDPACRDSKFRPGDFNLVLTNDDDRSLLEADRQPWKRRQLAMDLVGYELSAEPPRVLLAPTGALAKAEQERWVDLDRLCVLDRAPGDFSTPRILATLGALDRGGSEAAAVLKLLRGETPAGWPASSGEASDTFAAVLEPAGRAYGRPVLNRDQERAWRQVFDESLSVVWGPPGTGKTYLLAWALVGLAAAAHRAGRPCRILVTAATHRAVVNVLARLDKEIDAAGVSLPLRLVKLRGSGSEADAELEGTSADLVADTALPGLLAEADATGIPLIVGSTVWSLWKQMRAAQGPTAEGEERDPVASWFDTVVIDEASQMKVPEALIALSSVRRGARVILCGDDRQLAPVLRGRYGAESGTLFGSAFGHFASHARPSVLRESRRMNEALVAYPRRLFYPGLFSARPDHRIQLGDAPLDPDQAALRDLFLDPANAVVLCTYRGVRATARNVFEARLAAGIVRVARSLLLDPLTGERYPDAPFVADALAIVSPHRAQNSAILTELRALGMTTAETPVVDTVERMQGNERELILVSYAVADREYAEAEAGFLLNANRFNVAVTRARAKLILLVSEEVLDAVPTDELVMEGSMALKGYVAHCRDGARDFVLPGPDGSPVELRCRYRSL